MAPLTDLQKFGQSLWYDNISRDLLQSGAIKKLIDEGITGMTSNPAIFEKAITGSAVYDVQLAALAVEGKTPHEIFEAIAVDDIRAAADLLLPVYQRTHGMDGFVSLEVSPFLAHDTQGTIEEALRLAKWVDRRNLMVKIPASPEGIPAIEECVAQGLNINITLIFSREMYALVMEAYIRGIERRVEASQPVDNMASVASFFVSRVDSLVDKLLEDYSSAGTNKNLKALKGHAAIANAKLAYQLFKTTFDKPRFKKLATENHASIQRPLWASTSTKNPDYRDVMYVEALIGPNTVNTAPPATIDAFRDHGTAAATLELGIDDAKELESALAEAGIDMAKVTDQLLTDAVKLFAEPFQKLLDAIDVKRHDLVKEL